MMTALYEPLRFAVIFLAAMLIAWAALVSPIAEL